MALIADLEVGIWLANIGMVRRAVERLVKERPEVVLIAGDFLYQHWDELDAQMGLLADLLHPLNEAGIPTYAVLGNHDYGLLTPGSKPNECATARLRAVLREVGIHVLENEALPLNHWGRQRCYGWGQCGCTVALGGPRCVLPRQRRTEFVPVATSGRLGSDCASGQSELLSEAARWRGSLRSCWAHLWWAGEAAALGEGILDLPRQRHELSSRRME